MKLTGFIRILGLIAVAALLAAPMGAQAAYPDRPITVVIPFGAGGSHDLHARGVTSIMTDIVGQPVIVKLLPGGAGMKATGFVAKARPDGYTILFTHNGIDQLVPQTRKVPFNTLKDFKTVARINFSTNIWISPPNKSWKTAKEFIAYAKKHPGKLNFAHSGVWGSGYTSYMMLAKATGIKTTLIPHKGGGPALRALLAGRVDASFSQTVQTRPHLKAGKLLVLAIMGNERLTKDPDFKDVPSMKDLGHPGVGFQMERIFVVPSKISPDRLNYLRDAFVKLTKNKSYKRFMRSIGMPAQFMGGGEYDKLRPKKYAVFTDLIKSVTGK
ncbi:tripartite tricarboxylate transporter substrate binding protein [Nitrospinota bacterium]